MICSFHLKSSLLCEYLSKYKEASFLTIQCNICNVISFVAVRLHLQYMNSKASEVQ
jgi:hypothetical protein